MNTEHPRFGQRLQTFGGLLIAIVVTAHMSNHRTMLLAGVLLCLGLIARLMIEWSIVGDESEEDLEPKYRRLRLLNQFSFVVAVFGFMGLMHEQ
jgi:uncharacterized membrane protein